MDAYNLPLEEKGAIRLFLGCCCTRHKVDFKLRLDKVVDYDEIGLNGMEIDTGFISGVSVGPRTTVELYSGPNLDGERTLVQNSSNTTQQMLDLGCSKNNDIWKGGIRSFRIWSYEYYQKMNGIRYCSSNNQCSSAEYCLCPTGQIQPEWCPKEKQRCLPISRYIQSGPPELTDYDAIHKQCINNKIANMKTNSINLNDIKNIANQCAYDNKKYIEGFNSYNMMDNTITCVILIIIVLLLIYLFCKN